MVLTKVTTPVIGWVASILGWIINAVYEFLDFINIPNIGLAIILFTIIVYLLMMPLQIKQQRFSRMNVLMQPELQKIQNKYKNKKNDQEAMLKQNEEISAVYQKYGVSPTGSCLQLLIQMPVLLALYQVIYRIPGYVNGVKEIFTGLGAHIMSVNGFGDILRNFLTNNDISMYGINAKTEFGTNEVIDFLYRLSPAQMEKFSKLPEFSDFSSMFEQAAQKANSVNSFGLLDISDTPMAVITSGAGIATIVCAILIPILAWGTQMLNYKLMPQQTTDDKKEPNTMEASMKSMNTVMPIMSAVFCLTLPVGIGIYWIAGAVIRSIQQVILNRVMDNMDMEEYIQKNQEKAKKKIRKNEITAERIQQQARVNTKNIQDKAKAKTLTAEQKAENVRKSTEYYNNTEYKSGSIASKANMVKQFDEKNKKK